MSDELADGPLTTLTHARIRALQGDVAAARRILTALLKHTPEDAEARAALDELAGRVPRPPGPEVEEAAAPPPERGVPREMAARIKGVLGGRSVGPDRVVRQLEEWLRRVQRNAGASVVRG